MHVGWIHPDLPAASTERLGCGTAPEVSLMVHGSQKQPNGIMLEQTGQATFA